MQRSKRKLPSPVEDDDQQENNPDRDKRRIRQPPASEDLCSPRAVQSGNTLSRFDSTWLALQRTGKSSSQPDSPRSSSTASSSHLLNTSWPGPKRRPRALPIVFQKSPRTPPLVTNKLPKTSSMFQTYGKAPKELNSSAANERSILMESPSFHRRNTPSKFDLSWQELNKTATGSSQSDTTANSSFSTCFQLLNTNWPGTKRRTLPHGVHHSSRTRTWDIDNELSDDSCTESPPPIKLVPEEKTKQYLPINQKANLKQNQRFQRGGYAEDLRRFLKKDRMDQRHIKDRVPNYTVRVLGISKECGLALALVAPEYGSQFNILLQKNQSELLNVGSKVQLYLNPSTKPMQLKDKQLIYCRPHNIKVLEG
ncbi:uncharacterized protein [Drosophila takahashii]|uniref:uncharacterized protein isoform X1 n=1 Tax=Drosophila takahashii TaxID=29030 RepID=UPI001CF8EADD|nr:uncharacterized protein LOC108062433 [Drosophila takahashii]